MYTYIAIHIYVHIYVYIDMGVSENGDPKIVPQIVGSLL